MNTKLSSALLAAALATAFALSGTAYAQTASDAASASPSKVVSYSDLDLSSPAGIRTLYGRIQNAAWRVCLQIIPVHSGIETTKCRDTLVQAAVEQVNTPALTAMHTGKSSDNRTARR